MLRDSKIIVGLLFVSAFAVLFQPVEANAAWGDFDPTFGIQGMAIDPVTGYHPRLTAVQPDGKILVTGYRNLISGGKGFFLRRYLSNGQLDTEFGIGGAAIGPETNSINTEYWGEKIVVQANGKIAVSGFANGFHAVWQFVANGKADTTFGQKGLQVLTNYPLTGNPFSDTTVQSGKLLLSVRKYIGGSRRVVLLRLTSSGALDNTFGSAGESVTGLTGDYNSGTVVEANGKITVSGVRFNNLSAKGLERKTVDGQPDLTFLPTNSNSVGSLGPGLVKTVNGKYVTRAVNLAANGSFTLVLDKFGPTGTFESSISPFNGFDGSCPEIFTGQTDGKVLLAIAGIMFRFNAELDSFSMETNYCSNLSGLTDKVRAARQTDDKMVFAGVSNGYLTIVRLSAD